MPSQNTVLSRTILSKAKTEQPHISKFCTHKTKIKNFTSWQKYYSFQYSSTVYDNTSCLWMLHALIICYSFICFAHGKTGTALERLWIAHSSLLPGTTVLAKQSMLLTITVPKYLWIPLQSVTGSRFQSSSIVHLRYYKHCIV